MQMNAQTQNRNDSKVPIVSECLFHNAECVDEVCLVDVVLCVVVHIRAHSAESDPLTVARRCGRSSSGGGGWQVGEAAVKHVSRALQHVCERTHAELTVRQQCGVARVVQQRTLAVPYVRRVPHVAREAVSGSALLGV